MFFEEMSFELDDKGFKEHAEYIGEDGLGTASGPSSPIMDLMRHYMGHQPFLREFLLHPKETVELMETMKKKYIEYYKLAVDSEAEVIIAYDDVDSYMVSPRIFNKYVAPVFKEYAEICHKKIKYL